MMKVSNIHIGLLFLLIISVSCAEEKQYSHREEIITQKIWKEDSIHSLQLFKILKDTLTTDSSLLTPQLDSASPKPTVSL